MRLGEVVVLAAPDLRQGRSEVQQHVIGNELVGQIHVEVKDIGRRAALDLREQLGPIVGRLRLIGDLDVGIDLVEAGERVAGHLLLRRIAPGGNAQLGAGLDGILLIGGRVKPGEAPGLRSPAPGSGAAVTVPAAPPAAGVTAAGGAGATPAPGAPGAGPPPQALRSSGPASSSAAGNRHRVVMAITTLLLAASRACRVAAARRRAQTLVRPHAQPGAVAPLVCGVVRSSIRELSAKKPGGRMLRGPRANG